MTTRLEDVQRDLTQLMDYNTILVGHSLECDLKVLKVRPRPALPLLFTPGAHQPRSCSSSTPA